MPIWNTGVHDLEGKHDPGVSHDQHQGNVKEVGHDLVRLLGLQDHHTDAVLDPGPGPVEDVHPLYLDGTVLKNQADPDDHPEEEHDVRKEVDFGLKL